MVDVPKLIVDYQETIRAINPEEQIIEYHKHHWRRWFEADDDLEYIIANYPEQLSRGEISRIARTACHEKSDLWIRRLFLAAMIWGFGIVGYGAWRTSKMLKKSDSLNVLRNTVDFINRGDVVAAYNMLSLPYCGPTFRSKYLYFVGIGFQLKPLPVVLDSIVIERLETLLGTGSKDWSNARGYLRYIQLINVWAKELGCRPDCIELFLFNYREDE